MALTFNADEIFEMAEQIERNGAKFYRKAAEGMSEGDAKKFFVTLAKMEDHHLEVFHAMRQALTAEEKKPTVFDPEGEGALYLHAMADGHVFDTSRDPSGMFTGKETVADVLRTAIGIEKDSVVFYLGMKKVVPARLGDAKIDDIIKEEMRHIAILNHELVKVL